MGNWVSQYGNDNFCLVGVLGWDSSCLGVLGMVQFGNLCTRVLPPPGLVPPHPKEFWGFVYFSADFSRRSNFPHICFPHLKTLHSHQAPMLVGYSERDREDGSIGCEFKIHKSNVWRFSWRQSGGRCEFSAYELIWNSVETKLRCNHETSYVQTVVTWRIPVHASTNLGRIR